jgi:sterol desaturase/sphingolipid hydroxylase (fatty acid hydroxylase superfamily)
VVFPIGAAIAAYRQLRHAGGRVTTAALLRHAFPKAFYTSRSFQKDAAFFLAVVTVYGVIRVVVPLADSATAAVVTASLLDAHVLERLFPAVRDSVPLSIGYHLLFMLLVLVAYDFGFTALHLLFHRVPFLWKLHEVHHSAEVLTPLSVSRFHPVEFLCQKVAEGVCVGVVYGVFYFLHPQDVNILTIYGLSTFGIALSSIGIFRHSHIWISYGPLNYVFSSPAMHQIHHSREARHRDKNMAQIFSFWDALLGTLYVPKEREVFEVGLARRSGGDSKHKPRFTE